MCESGTQACHTALVFGEKQTPELLKNFLTSVHDVDILHHVLKRREYEMSINLTDQEVDIVLFTLLRQADDLVIEQDAYMYAGNTLRAADVQKTRRRLDAAIAKIRSHSSTSVGTNYSVYA